MKIYIQFVFVFALPAFVFPLLSCTPTTPPQPHQEPDLQLGADLSYVNEMEDCGAIYRENGQTVDPFELFARKGASLIRLRLWHTPEWTNYSNLEDVKRSMRRARAAGMQVLLDFHYSDDWADPAKQLIPKAWEGITDREVLGDSVYQYTYRTLTALHREDLLPEFVQVGNEINSEILMREPAAQQQGGINWERNAYLLNRGLSAVEAVAHETGSDIQRMLHIAQPENAFPWFEAAATHQLTDFEWIALSYYPRWSAYALHQLPTAIEGLRKQFDKGLMIVETAYPYSLENHDQANNIQGEDALIEGYPATPEGQQQFMLDLKKAVIEGGGEGLLYWEPAWVSTPCSTRWGQGSHWENATFFNAGNANEVLPAIDFLKN